MEARRRAPHVLARVLPHVLEPTHQRQHMGLLDKMFGGGTKLELKLETDKIPEGGTLSGAISLSGGKKPMKLTALKVRLVYVKVTSVPGQTLPKIEMQVLLDNTVISNQDLAPASLNKYSFSFA